MVGFQFRMSIRNEIGQLQQVVQDLATRIETKMTEIDRLEQLGHRFQHRVFVVGDFLGKTKTGLYLFVSDSDRKYFFYGYLMLLVLEPLSAFWVCCCCILFAVEAT